MKRSTLAAAVALGILAATPVGAASADTKPPRPAPAPTRTTGEPRYTGAIVVRYAEDVTTSDRRRLEDSAGRAQGAEMRRDHALDRHTDVVRASRPQAARAIAAHLAEQPGVTSAEPALRVRAAANDPYLEPYQWNLRAAPGSRFVDAWPSSTGTGQIVAVVDTGITRHPDLDRSRVPGYDFVTDTPRDGNGVDSDPSDPGDWTTAGMCGGYADPADSSWHGTHVAGVIAAATDNGTGIAAAAPDTKVMPVRALGPCGGGTDEIAAAITWASGGSVPGTTPPARPAKIVNLSLGGPGTCPAHLQSAIDGVHARGGTVVVAAGNDNQDASGYTPANCSGVVVVAATGSTGTKASYSNSGTGVTLSAPGGDVDGGILSTVDMGTTSPADPWYGFMAGTSQATPHVSAAAALLYSERPHATRAEVRNALSSTTRPFTQWSWGMGTGILDAAAAVASITNSVPASRPVPAAVTMPARAYGTTRIDTAVAASRQWWTTSDTVYLASSEAFPDALSAGPAAARDGAPLLLTPAASLPTAVRAEITRLGAGRVVIVGGTGAVSTAVESGLKSAGLSVARIAGADRYRTNAAVAETFATADRAYLANGLHYADATSGGAAAAVTGRPLLLTPPDSLTPATTAALATLRVDKVDVVGGEAVVSRAVATALGTRLGGRYGGADRFATASTLVGSIATPGRNLVVTSGENWPDALVGAPVAKKVNGYVLPTRRTCTPLVVKNRIDTLSPVGTTIVGGPGVVAGTSLSTTC